MPLLPFDNREDAARRLAGELQRYRDQHPLVLAIPRGGVPLGRVIADELGGDLDVVLVRKLGAPANPEFAIGAIDELGHAHVGPDAGFAGADAAYLRRESARQLEVIRARRALYSPHRPRFDPRGRTVIVVDDGLATGATMAAALSATRAHAPARLVCAVPVAARSSLEELAPLADDIVCLAAPENFGAVSRFYRDFSPVEDDDVVRLLQSPPLSATARSGEASASVHVRSGEVDLIGDLTVPASAVGAVLFAHGSGSSRTSPRNRYVARELNRYGLATLLFDLLTVDEDRDRGTRFDIDLLSERLADAVRFAENDERIGHLPLGLFGASTGAAAALNVAALRPDAVSAVVSRGGRPDLSGEANLQRVAAPTLLIVGGADTHVLDLNRSAQQRLRCHSELAIVRGATHLFEEPGALERVAELSATWFERWLTRRMPSSSAAR